MFLENNQIIDIVITGIKSIDQDLIEEIPYSFTTVFSPLYSTPNKIRAIAGTYIKDVPDEMLIYLIHLYSVEADATSICSHTDFTKWSYYAGQWVTYNVALDAILNSVTYADQAGQKIYKKLGDFSISKDTIGDSNTPVNSMIDKLECQILKLSVSVKFCKEPLTSCDKGLIGSDLRNNALPKPVVKGELTARPVFGRTFYANGRHPQWTGIIYQYGRQFLTNEKPICPGEERFIRQ